MKFISTIRGLIPNSRATMARETEAAVAKAKTEVTLELTSKFTNYVNMLRYPRDRQMQAPHITGNEGVSSIPIFERVRSVAELRAQELNAVDVRAWLNQFSVHGVGPEGGTPVFNTSDKDWNTKANMLVQRALKDVDYRIPRVSFASWLQCLVRRLQIDGDALAVCDSLITGNKILAFETDQICDISNAASDFLRDGWTYTNIKGEQVPLDQTSGVLHDAWGKVEGYAVSNQRGLTMAAYDTCTIFTTEQAMLIYTYERFGQYRGNSPMTALLQTLADMKDIVASELKSAKSQALNTVLVKEKSTAAQRMMQLGITQQQSTDATAGAAAQLVSPIQPQHFEMLEEQTGGAVIHMPADGSEFEHLKNERPSRGIAEFDEYAKCSGGASIGLMKMFATGEVSTSFSAARAEMMLTWATFKCMHKFLENGVIAFYLTKLIEGFQKAGKLGPCPDEKIPCECYKLRWPIAPMLNPGAEVTATLDAIKGGLTSWSDELGPDSDEMWERLKKNIEYLKANGMDFISALETKSGAPSSVPEKDDTNEATPVKTPKIPRA